MVPGRNPGAADIVALALAFHRAPTQYADLLHGRTPLPPGVGTLLKLAGGSEPDPAHAALARADELKAAALFFIEQALFHHDAGHYRVLGLEPGAPIEQIKEHHRLLMRVFHPDRENRADDWKDAFATRINLAYTALRDPDARRRYDATLKQAARPGTAAATARKPAVHPKPASPRLRTDGLPPLLLRYLPQWVLAGSALIACAVVGAVYLNNPPAPPAHAREAVRFAPPAREAPVARAPAAETIVAAAAEAAPPTAPVARPQPPARIPPAAHSTPLAPAPALVRMQAPAPTERPLHPVTRLAQNDPPAPRAQAAPPRQAASPQPVAAPPAKLAASDAAAPAPAQARVAPALPSAPPEPSVAAAPARPALPDPNVMLAQFMSSYEHGDTQAFMALFDDLAIGKAGGKRQIRREHEALFQSTELRHIEIDDMAWSRDGDWLRGTGHYRTTLMKKGELRLQTESGIVRIELIRRGDRALIMGLDYQPGERT
jgi:hypothetical protein